MTSRHVLIVPAWWPSPEAPLAGTFVMDYARAFAAAGMRVGVVCPDLVSVRHWRVAGGIPVRPRLAAEAEHGIPAIRIRGLHTALGVPALQMRRFAAWLRRGCVRYVELFGMPDVVHAHCAIPAGWASLQLVEKPGPPVVITEHTGPFALALGPLGAARYTRTAIRDAAAVAAVSPQQREQMVAGGIDREIVVIPNPVSPEFSYAPPPPAESAPDGRRRFRVAFVGRLVQVKGVQELADAAERLAASPDVCVEWHLVGDGPEDVGLRERLRISAAQGRVRFHGRCEKERVAEIVRASHLFVLPSHGESGALAVSEALVTGRPAIGTLGTACENMIGPQDGILCHAQDVEGLTTSIRRALVEYDRWDSRAIAERARQRFSSRVVAAQYRDLFERVLRNVAAPSDLQ